MESYVFEVALETRALPLRELTLVTRLSAKNEPRLHWCGICCVCASALQISV